LQHPISKTDSNGLEHDSPAATTPQHQHQPQQKPQPQPQQQTQQPSFLPPPPTPGSKSTILALCPQIPPSMQRAEWCLDDYIVMEKLYKGYASVGES
jgi:hypothetical protein